MSWRWYTTTYSARPRRQGKRLLSPEIVVGDYASHIWASSRPHAEKLAKQRNIGERVTGGTWRKRQYRYASELLRRPRLNKKQALDAVHAVCFLSYLLMRSSGAKAEDILGDEGLLHMAIHSVSFGWPGRRKLAAGLEYFERQVPGYRSGRG